MPNCHLIVDSCCDIPPELIARSGITLLKFPYVMNNATFEDDLFQTMSAQEFYGAMRKGAEPSTAQLTIPLLQSVFREAAEEGTPTVYLSFTSGLSGSYDAAMLVRDQIAEEYPDFELYVVDTLLASIAEGFLVFEAINQWEKGISARELADWATEARYFVDCEFMVDDLDALKRGGRIPGTVAAAGAALDVKPLLTIDVEGKLQLVGVARGRKKGIKQLIEYYRRHVAENGRGKCVFLGNSDCVKDMQRLREGLEKLEEGIVFINGTIGPVIGSHTGPDMVALVFWGDDKRESLSVADRIAMRVRGEK